MRSRSLAVMAALCLALAGARSAEALQACAVSPDGTKIVAGGENRVLYVLDGATREVTDRVWLGCRVERLYFTSDGSQCVVAGDGNQARVLSSEDWSVVKEVPEAGLLALASDAPVAVNVGRKRGGSWKDRALIVWSLPDWEAGAEIDLPEALQPFRIALSPDGKTVYVRTGRTENPEEKSVDPGEKPDDHFEQSLWRERNDGYVSDLLQIDVGSGEVKKRVRCFDASNNFRIYPTDSGVVCADYSQYVGVWDVEKDTYEARWTDGFAYGSGTGPKGNIYTGSLASFLVISSAGEVLAKGSVSKLPGFPEYFRDFAPLGEDKVVAVTDASRVIVIDANEHKVLEEKPVY